MQVAHKSSKKNLCKIPTTSIFKGFKMGVSTGGGGKQDFSLLSKEDGKEIYKLTGMKATEFNAPFLRSDNHINVLFSSKESINIGRVTPYYCFVLNSDQLQELKKQ